MESEPVVTLKILPQTDYNLLLVRHELGALSVIGVVCLWDSESQILPFVSNDFNIEASDSKINNNVLLRDGIEFWKINSDSRNCQF